MRTTILTTAILSLVSGSAAAQDWPRWRGEHFDDTSRATEVFGDAFELRAVWRRPVGSGYSAVSILDGLAVTQASSDGSDFVVALDAVTGAERWRHRIGPTFPGLDGANDGPVSTPTLHEGAVYALGPFGDLLALDLETGKEIWRKHLVEEFDAVQPHWGFTTAPLVASGNVVVQAGGPSGSAVMAFVAATGEVHWRTGTDKIDYQSPILAEVAGTEQLIGCGGKWLFGLDPRDGRQLWKVDHRGSEFYRRIVNPLVIEGELLFLKNRRNESALLSLGSAEDGFPVDELWATRYLRSNYNMAVYLDGHIYGMNSGFLTCIEMFEGERVWRSRPPGDGWIILVDEHLVVLTKAGTLHVVPASPDGYEERASLTLFNRLTWTPPSFANGRIYARDSFDEVACVEIVPVERGAVAAAIEERPGDLLDELERRLADADDPAAVVDEFLAAQASFPVLEGERVAHVFYRGEAEDLTLRTNAVAEGTVDMQRVGATDLFAASFEVDPDARLYYQFVRDYDEVLTDPRNPSTTEVLGFGPVSSLHMPAAATVELPESLARGRMESFTQESRQVRVGGQTWGGRRRIDVYLPAGYDENEASYPVLYVNDGANALGQMHMQEVLDSLVGRTVQPLIVVFVQTVSAYELARSQRHVYGDMLVSDLVPKVDAKYRTIREPRGRAMHGTNEGGYGALYAALKHPDVFGAVAAQSVYTGSMQGKTELAALATQLNSPPAVYLDWGKYDTRDHVRDIDTPRFSRELVEALRKAGCRLEGGEHPDGETFACWADRLPALLESLFPLSED